MTTRLPPGRPIAVAPHMTLPDPGAPDDYEPLPDAMKQEPHFTEAMQVVRSFFLGRSAALVSGYSPIYYVDEEGTQQIVRPDCYVAFNVDEVAIRRRNGYYLRDVGRPPDFVLEIASESTHTEDTGRKRELYARVGIGEYWRFDNTGGEFYPYPLVGELLVDGEYHPIEMEQDSEGVIWGRSPALGLDLCWCAGRLRLYDPVAMSYLRNLVEAEAVIDLEQAARRDAEALVQAAEARANAEAAARREAEALAAAAEAAYGADRARIRQLEEELRRLQSEK